MPPGLAEIDGAAIGGIHPDANAIPGKQTIKRGAETANNTEFNLFEDGTLMKYIERPGFAPQCILVDGAGREFGVARNSAVADMICNGVNALNLAMVLQLKEDQDKRIEQQAANNPGGAPPALLLPPGFEGGDK